MSEKSVYPDVDCLYCEMGHSTVKLRRQHVHLVKFIDHAAGTKKHKLVPCPRRNLRSTIKKEVA